MKNWLCALQNSSKQEGFPDVVTSMFEVFITDVYDLLDHSDTL